MRGTRDERHLCSGLGEARGDDAPEPAPAEDAHMHVSVDLGVGDVVHERAPVSPQFSAPDERAHGPRGLVDHQPVPAELDVEARRRLRLSQDDLSQVYEETVEVVEDSYAMSD